MMFYLLQAYVSEIFDFLTSKAFEVMAEFGDWGYMFASDVVKKILSGQEMKKRNGQISIEYIAGFIFFLFTILFVVYSMIDRLPQYFEETKDTVLHEAAWMASERMIGYAVFGGEASGSAISNISGCTLYGALPMYSAGYNNSKGNYTYFKSLFGIGDNSEFRLTFSGFAILLPNGTSGVNYTGLVSIDGATTAFEIFNYTPGRYGGLHIGTFYSREKETVIIASKEYVVEKIDPEGLFAIISRNLADCGRPPAQGKATASVNRFATYNGSVARLRLVVWG